MVRIFVLSVRSVVKIIVVDAFELKIEDVSFVTSEIFTGFLV